MKKTITIACIIALVALAACSKTKGKTGGSWTFKGITYTPTFVNYILGAFTGYTQDNLPTGSLAFTFLDTLANVPRPDVVSGIGHPVYAPWGMAPHTGIYPVTSHNPPDSGYVYVVLTDTSATRAYYSVPNSTPMVNVTMITTLDNSGKSTTIADIRVTGLIMKSTLDPSDSSTLDAHLTQINY